ncbi:biotin/lipoyl-containing protein, partial [Streptococcus suis]|uniref:biotin/lipoyl-containing protein n=1 Tax=Streptococcus suis TaxID=1307 RepID=UPI0006CE1154
MAIEIIMPKLGVDMQEGEIIEWKKQEGDFVNEGDVILEMMSDKTSMELEAEESGVLLKIVHGNGATVPVTEVIAYLGAEGESVEVGAEVQKGNAIEERKIQRLFRNGAVTRLIKKSNDFGAGG